MADAKQKVRSPSYPNMSLGDAVDAVGKIEIVYRSANVDREAGAKLLGYSSLSGPANKALSALAQYGLVERAGKGQMRVTGCAKAILHPDAEDEKMQNLSQAAFEPTLFRELQERFPGITPPMDGIETFLNRKGFNQSAIRPAAKAYLDTLLFLEQSGATESHGLTGANDADSGLSEAGNKPVYGGAQEGDLVQWERDGILQMEKPMRVRAVHELDGQVYVAVEGSETGIPMNQVIVEEKAPGQTELPRIPFGSDLKADAVVPTPEGTRKAMFPLDEGDVTLVFPEGISRDSLEDLSAYLSIFLKKEMKKTDALD